MTPFPYRVSVRWSEPDAAYVAEVPAVHGAGGDGQTPEEAVRAAQESVAELLEVKKEHGDPIPPPDFAEPEFSGQIRLRMAKSLHRELAIAAEKEGVSLNHLMVTYLAMQLRTPSFTMGPAMFRLSSATLAAFSPSAIQIDEKALANVAKVVSLRLSEQDIGASAATVDKDLLQ